MSAVADISKPDTAVMFAASRDGLRLVKEQRYPIHGPGGRQVGEQPGQALVFRDGVLRVTEDGVTLEDGKVLSAEEALAFLRKHRLFGDSLEGFREIAQAAPPVSQAELEAMMAATWDEEALVAIISVEEAGWQRDALLGPARNALERLREAMAAATQQAAEALEAASEGPAAPKRAPKRAAG